ncbi:MAG: ParA family partition ATPase [Pseudomonadota bacterium]
MQSFVISVAQQKGGAGKSTLVAHLGAALSKFGKKVAIIDTDPQQTILNWFNVRKDNEFVNKFNLDVSSSTGWKINNEVSKFYKHDFILIDSPPHMETETKSIIRAADLVIVPCQPSPNDLWATKATLEIINNENKPMALVINRCPPQSKLLKTIEDQFDKNIKRYYLGNRVAHPSAMLTGLTSIETEPNSIAAREILQIAENVYNSFPIK